MGTPEGTGMSRGRFLAPGDRIGCWIEGLGLLENEVARAAEEQGEMKFADEGSCGTSRKRVPALR